MDILSKIKEYATPEYQKFSSALIPGCSNILGVRIPDLRAIAKSLSVEEGLNYLSVKENYFEEVMVKGLFIGFLKLQPTELIKVINGFLPKVTNWSLCDSFCAGLKIVKKQPDKFFEYFKNLTTNEQTYFVRVGVVTLLFHYITESYIDKVLEIFKKVDHSDYYVKMAVAWGFSACYAKFPKRTLPIFESKSLDVFTHNKAIQKSRESLRVSKEDKDYLNTLKIK